MAKTNCPKCGSSDANEVYDDGGAHCFSCGDHTFPTDEGSMTEVFKQCKTKGKGIEMLEGGVHAPFRGITAEACKKYDYRIHNQALGRNGVHSAPYHDRSGKLVAQHLRDPADKKFMPFAGNAKGDTELQMFGQHLFAKGGKKIFVCEGEVDTLSAYSAMGHSWPVVGLAGASRVDKVFKANMEFLMGFDQVVLCLDNDEAGREATKVALDLLPFGTLIVKDFPAECKDINDVLNKGGTKAVYNLLHYKAEEFIPDGIKKISSVMFEADNFDVTLFPWDAMNHKMFARRSGEITLHTSGSGMGKSTFVREIVSSLLDQGEKCGLIMLEESTEETKADLMSLQLNKPVRKILAQRKINSKMVEKGLEPLYKDVIDLSIEELNSAEHTVNESGLMLLDHSQGYTVQSVLTQIRYLAVSQGVKHIFLDHITILVSSDKEIENEVKAVDVIMGQLRGLVEELNINIDLVCHLRKKSNGQKSVNTGGDIAVEDLRGSGGLYQISNNILSYSRDQHDEERKNITQVRSLKSRLGGYTGLICELKFTPETGKITEYEHEDKFDKESEDY